MDTGQVKSGRTTDGPGWALYVGAVCLLALQLDPAVFDPQSPHFLLIVGAIAVWRYSWGALHLARAAIYLLWTFPELRRQAVALGDRALPPEIYVIVTSYREVPSRSIQVFRALLRAAEACGAPATVIAVVTDPAEQSLVEALLGTEPSVRLATMVQDGSGKRTALAEALRLLARRAPDPRAVVFLMDGDTLLEEDTLARCLPFFGVLPGLRALTTDARAELPRGWTADWHELRYAQRHVLMASMSLSRRLLVLTGRLSAFRADIATHPDFIAQMEKDSLDHWRYGRFRFLTGDDKSSWFWLLRQQHDMIYVADVAIRTLEDLQGATFLARSQAMMRRWFGNMLRNNGRALALGPRRTGLFVWWCLLDQRLSMWTTLTGPAFALLWSAFIAPRFLLAYAVWVLATRLLHAGILGLLRRRLSPRAPLLLYYTQVIGSLTKIYIGFRLNRQSWPRQKITRDDRRRSDIVWDNYLSALAAGSFLFGTALIAGPIQWPEQIAVAALAARFPEAAPIPPSRAGELQRLIDTAPAGAVIQLAGGDFRLAAPLTVDRDDITIAGAGTAATRLIADFPGQGLAILAIRGQRHPRRCATLAAAAKAANRQIEVAGIEGEGAVMITAANDAGFLDAIGARRWRRTTPELRRTLAWGRPAGDGALALSAPLGLDVPQGSRVCPMRLRRGVTVRDLTITYALPGAPDPGLYANARPEAGVDGIQIIGAANPRIERISVIGAGRHPLHLDTVLEPQVIAVNLEGAWNKGGGGNGYLRLARTVRGRFSDIRVRGLRHVTFQWSSHHNAMVGLDSDSDVNFHGGFAHHNHVETTRLRPRPGHPWPAVVRTPPDAAWAPPDGPANTVATELQP